MPYICQECGAESFKWFGRCPQCGAWNSLVEKIPTTSTVAAPPPLELSEITLKKYLRLTSSLRELDRVLGGGIVPGSVTLLAGDPGVGKSTLLLQLAASLSRQGSKVVYASGEETVSQIKLRADRLGVAGQGLYLISETDLEVILEYMNQISPALGIVDSIQTVYLSELGNVPGSLAQVRESTLKLTRYAKEKAVPLLITGHVTKEGAIAGPKVLEHIVDVVLYLEGETYSSYRILRGIKNRFGSTNEVGVFEMTAQGLAEVENPSALFLSPHREEAIGCAVSSVIEGTRPFLVEIQALTTPTPFSTPRRLASGVDFSRLLLISAILSERLGLPLGNRDIMVNVVGGFKVSEPAADLATALAIISSFKGLPVSSGLVAVGELGLSGELRAVPQLEKRLAEAQRLGFKSCLLPSGRLPSALNNIGLRPVANLKEAVKEAFGTH